MLRGPPAPGNASIDLRTSLDRLAGPRPARYRPRVARLLVRILTAVQLTRLTIAFGAVSDVWFVILLTREEAPSSDLPAATMPWPWSLLAGAVVAVGLTSCGAALNDVMDARHDATFSPQRPIPAGRVRSAHAMVVAVGSLIAAILAAAAFGIPGVCIALLTAAGILFYNATARFIPAVGLPTIGLVHATLMFIPNHLLAFTLPVWLILTHTMAINAAVHVLEDKRPRLRQRTAVAAIVGWLAWSAIVIGLGASRSGGVLPAGLDHMALLGPMAAMAGFLAVAAWKTSGVTPEVAAEKLKRYGAMWQSLYGAAWLLALGQHTEAAAIACFAVLGFAAMTLIKELIGLTGQPVGYR